MDNHSNEHIEMALLMSADESEACVIESMLEAADIPVERRYSSFASAQVLYGGSTIFGVELYVPGSCLERARDIVEAIPDSVPEFEEE